MQSFLFILLLLSCVLISSVIDRFVPKISSPLIQIGLGILVFFIVGNQDEFLIDSDYFMVLFVAPLLYNEARKANTATLVKNRSTILSLSIGLVVVTTLVIGFTLNLIVPSIPLAAAFALGAALGPTDAIAVTSLPDDVRIGKRRESILQGECLINDASGIIAFQASIAAVTTGVFSVTGSGLEFLKLFIGGIVIGLLLGAFARFLLRWARNTGLDNITFHVLFDLFFPFISYFAGEFLGVSGIITVVASGFVISGVFSRTTTKQISPKVSKTSIVSSSVWEVLIFTLTGIVFVILGDTLPSIVIASWRSSDINNIALLSYSLAIVGVMVLIRFIWIYVLEGINSKKEDCKFFKKENLQSALIMTIGGAKGAVSLAIMFTIPVTLLNGQAFPRRQILLFIAGAVVIFSIILSNFILPLLMPRKEKAKVIAEEGRKEDLAVVTIDILRKVIEDLTSMINVENRTAVQSVIKAYSNRIALIKKRHDFEDSLNISYRKKAYMWEREFVTEQLLKQNISPKVARRFLSKLSAKVDLLEHHTSLTWKVKNNIVRGVNFVKLFPKRTKNIAKGSYARPGETVKFSTINLDKHEQFISTMSDLKIATYAHVISKLDKEIKDDSSKSEDLVNIIGDYRMQLQTLREKSPSLTRIKAINKDIEMYTRIGLQNELEYIQEKYENEEISRPQFRNLYDNVLLMQVALEEFD